MMVTLSMRVNNQRLFQEFALQTPKTKPKGFVRGRKDPYTAPWGGMGPLVAPDLGLALGYDTFHPG